MLSLDSVSGDVNVNNLAVLRGLCLMRPSATFCALTPVFEEALTPSSPPDPLLSLQCTLRARWKDGWTERMRGREEGRVSICQVGRVIDWGMIAAAELNGQRSSNRFKGSGEMNSSKWRLIWFRMTGGTLQPLMQSHTVRSTLFSDTRRFVVYIGGLYWGFPVQRKTTYH